MPLGASTTYACRQAIRLEKLVGACAGQYSIRVNDQWRICFTWSASGAANVELVDYH
jgi:proteic killer suppression protein